jgi:tripartite ATP-independent transporter DctM subunit
VDEALPLLMFVALLGAMMLGYPVAFSLGGVALIFAGIGTALELFYIDDLAFIPARIFGVVQNFTLIAVPLFIMMGITLDKSGLAQELLEAMQLLLRKVKGGLAISVVLVGALLAASTGIVGATVVTMGAIALPTMLRWGYQKELACGTIAASGTLGQIIPPSIVLVLLGDLMNVDVADLFLGAICPGFILVLVYMLYIWIRVHRNPLLAPVQNDPQWEGLAKQALAYKLIYALLPAGALMFMVLGTILCGMASPTEASACGAIGALGITAAKGRLNKKMLGYVTKQTVLMTTMVFTILMGAQFFGVVFRGLRGDEVIQNFILDAGIPPEGVLFFVMLLMFVMGFFLDFIEICFIIIPVVGPLLVNVLGFNALWLAILMAINLQTSFLTPPFGFALFYLKGTAPAEVKTSHIYRGAIPFVALQICVLILISVFPSLVTGLPKLLQ